MSLLGLSETNTIGYYKSMNILRHTTWCPSYRHKTFPTQTFRDLLVHNADGTGGTIALAGPRRWWYGAPTIDWSKKARVPHKRVL